jgi:hypothetical protein
MALLQVTAALLALSHQATPHSTMHTPAALHPQEEEAFNQQLEQQVSALRAATGTLEATTRQQAESQGPMHFALSASAGVLGRTLIEHAIPFSPHPCQPWLSAVAAVGLGCHPAVLYPCNALAACAANILQAAAH